MLECEYCGRECKSKAGLSRHMSACESKPEIGASLVDIANEISDEVDAVMGQATFKVESLEEKLFPKDPEAKVVQLEVVGEGNYYVGHPRRIIKLRGLLSRTFDKAERDKILGMILHENH